MQDCARRPRNHMVGPLKFHHPIRGHRASIFVQTIKSGPVSRETMVSSSFVGSRVGSWAISSFARMHEQCYSLLRGRLLRSMEQMRLAPQPPRPSTGSIFGNASGSAVQQQRPQTPVLAVSGKRAEPYILFVRFMELRASQMESPTRIADVKDLVQAFKDKEICLGDFYHKLTAAIGKEFVQKLLRTHLAMYAAHKRQQKKMERENSRDRSARRAAVQKAHSAPAAIQTPSSALPFGFRPAV